MNRTWLAALVSLCATASLADDAATTPPVARPRGVPIGSAKTNVAEDDVAPVQAGDKAAAKFSTTDKWSLAGYNNNEVVYTIIVTNEDTRILHCTTLMNGWYLEDGKKLSISDRQSTTVFPDQPTQVGNWMDMDQASGATYTVKCRPM